MANKWIVAVAAGVVLAASAVVVAAAAPRCTTVDAYSTIQAETWCAQSGVQTETTSDVGGGKNVGWIKPGDWISYDVNFGSVGAVQANVRVAAMGTGSIYLRTGSSSGTVFASIPVTSTGSWQSWVTTNIPTSVVQTGVKRVYVTFGGASGVDFVNINWLQFVPGVTPTPAPSSTAPVPSPTATAIPGTAAERFGWGTPLPASDEFSYTGAPDSAKWYSLGGCVAGHGGNGRRCDANSQVANGILTQSGFNNGDTGWMGSKLAQKYGRYEVRVRTASTGVDTGRQYHPVFIVWPASNNWPADGEYDWLENFAPGEACAHGYLHYPSPVDTVLSAPAYCPSTPMSEWYNVAFEWNASGVTGYVDGVQWYHYEGGAGPDGRSNIQDMPLGYMTIQLDNFYGSNLTPAKIDVDWVHIYGPSSTPAPSVTPTPSPSTTAPAGAVVYRDEFNSLSNWNLYNSKGHDNQGLRSPSQCTVSSGLAVLTGTTAGTTCGMSLNGHNLRYGTVSVRAQSPPGAGKYHPVALLWGIGSGSGVDAATGEVDYLELWNRPARDYNEFTLHYGDGSQTIGGGVAVDATQWHTYSVTWTPTYMAAYVDGVQYYRTTDTAKFPPGYMECTLQLDWFPFENTTSGSAVMYVDWLEIRSL